MVKWSMGPQTHGPGGREALLKSGHLVVAGIGKTMKSISEDDDHKSLVKKLRGAGIFFEHPPLGGKRSAQVGRHMKELGAVAGSSDFRIYSIPPNYPNARGASFELKKRGKPKGLPKHQEEFLVELGALGWIVGWGDIHDFLAWMRWIGFDL